MSHLSIHHIQRKQHIRRLTIKLLLASILMFGFGYALVPLYNVMCKSLGINGKTSMVPSSAVASVDMSRVITVQFLTTNNQNLPWKFYPRQVTIHVHPGQNTHVSFYAKNESGKMMIVQAIPSVSPGVAAKYLRKTECFCFKQQSLASQADTDLPLIFHIDRALPKDIDTVTLSYTLFDVTNRKRPVSVDKTIGHIS